MYIIKYIKDNLTNERQIDKMKFEDTSKNSRNSVSKFGISWEKCDIKTGCFAEFLKFTGPWDKIFVVKSISE